MLGWCSSCACSQRTRPPWLVLGESDVLREAVPRAMATAARRRLMRDFKRMQTDPPEGVNGAPLDNDIMKWHAVIFG